DTKQSDIEATTLAPTADTESASSPLWRPAVTPRSCAAHTRLPRWSSGDLQLGIGVQRIAGRGGSPNRPDESEPDCQLSTSESFRNQISPTSRSTVVSAVLSRAISLRWDSAGYSNSLCHVRHGEFVLWWIERSRDISR